MTRFVTVLALALAAALPPTALALERASCADARAKVQAELDAACPCASAASHADYVRCVNEKLRTLSACHKNAEGKQECGPVPRRCIGELRRTAVRSACGDASLVTCCVPRARDCVDDRTPGDGKKDGKCTGTTQPCDTIADCKIPKCQTAPSAERCTLVGGTVGHGPDCSTACAP